MTLNTIGFCSNKPHAAGQMLQPSLPSPVLGPAQPEGFIRQLVRLGAAEFIRPKLRIIDPAAEAVENRALIRKLADFKSNLDTAPAWKSEEKARVQAAISQIIHDAESLEGNGHQHMANDVLASIAAKIDRAGGPAPADVLRERLDSPVANFGVVLEDILYRGGQPNENGLRWLASQGVKTIVNLRDPRAEKETGYPGMAMADEQRNTSTSM
jgi:hypothetical protein